MGICLHTFHAETLATISVFARSYHFKDRHARDWALGIGSMRQEKINYMADCFEVDLIHANPIAVISEAPFFTPKSPDAFQALSQLIEHFRIRTFSHRRLTPFYTVEPRTVKKIFAGKGNLEKDEMLAALVAKADLADKLTVPLSSLDEHSVDAIAIGFYLMHQFREKLLPIVPPIF